MSCNLGIYKFLHPSFSPPLTSLTPSNFYAKGCRLRGQYLNPVTFKTLSKSTGHQKFIASITFRSCPEPAAHRVQKSQGKTVDDHAEHLVSTGKLSASDAPLLKTLTNSRAALFRRVLTNRTRHITFVLDGVHGPHNLAAIARSCDAWGVQDVHFVTPPNVDDSYVKTDSKPLLQRFETDRSVQAVSKNCHKWLTISEHSTPEVCIKHLRAAGYKIFVSSLEPDAHSVHTIDVSSKCAFVFGNEVLGVSQDMKCAADAHFTIPMVGFVESMNVSVAVATTASLTIPRSRVQVKDDTFFLSQLEARELAHHWLHDRPRPKGRPAQKFVQGDVTRLGTKVEHRLLRDGLFSPSSLLDTTSLTDTSFWRSSFRLHAHTGGLLVQYLNRRKIGALGDKRWKGRCEGVVYSIAGSHALSCEAAIQGLDWSKRIERSLLLKYFSALCKSINNLYEPLFDEFAEPNVPVYASESEALFRRVEDLIVKSVLPVLFQFSSEVLLLGSAKVRSLLLDANLIDIARCLTDCTRFNESLAFEFETILSNALGQKQHFVLLKSEKNGSSRLLSMLNDTSSLFGSDTIGKIPRENRILLHVAIRLYHAAFLASEIHQAAWNRTKNNTISRVRALRFNILENVACEAFSEMMLLNSSIDVSLLRVAIEWYHPLWIIQREIQSSGSTDHSEL